jgi:hypothetical protein
MEYLKGKQGLVLYDCCKHLAVRVTKHHSNLQCLA